MKVIPKNRLMLASMAIIGFSVIGGAVLLMIRQAGLPTGIEGVIVFGGGAYIAGSFIFAIALLRLALESKNEEIR